MAKFNVKITVKAGTILRSEGLTADEVKLALAEVDRIAALDNPKIDPTIEPIAATHDVWHRQKPVGVSFRSILHIETEKQQITIYAIMRRDDETYRRVFILFRDWNP